MSSSGTSEHSTIFERGNMDYILTLRLADFKQIGASLDNMVSGYHCEVCKHEVVISKPAHGFITQNPNIKPICFHCDKDSAELAPVPDNPTMTPEREKQILEVMKEMRQICNLARSAEEN